MKIIGKDGKEYASVKECLTADKNYDLALEEQKIKDEQEKKALSDKIATEKAELSARKKEYANKIESAKDEVDYYKKEYEKAKLEAKKIVDEANDKAEEILKGAAKSLEEASEKKMIAIAEFNKEFGPYQTTLTGLDAINEYNKVVKQMDDMLNNLFSPFSGIWWKF